ncbi:LysR family transcriptional regulator [Alicyclobacillus suci]|uniref:LysR family transcriptional regulator n=1 Tax=Alicyclobacillus suci TaxID=2816080 RepID=UPI001A8C1C61|nr:LysR family transcriptional regulator [Alicyclobacillus suci]
MELHDLKVFLAVAEEGSITKAAQRLGYVQSNVTARIHQLESELHTKLFYRHRRGVQLTPLGDTILPYAKKIFSLCHQMQALVQDDSNPSGPLRIGSMETTAAIRLPKIFTTYHNTYPNVELVLVTGPTSDLLQAVLDYQIDGAFVSSPIKHPDVVQEASVQEELVLIANKTETLRLPSCIQERKLLVFRKGCSS